MVRISSIFLLIFPLFHITLPTICFTYLFPISIFLDVDEIEVYQRKVNPIPPTSREKFEELEKNERYDKICDKNKTEEKNKKRIYVELVWKRQ